MVVLVVLVVQVVAWACRSESGVLREVEWVRGFGLVPLSSTLTGRPCGPQFAVLSIATRVVMHADVMFSRAGVGCIILCLFLAAVSLSDGGGILHAHHHGPHGPRRLRHRAQHAVRWRGGGRIYARTTFERETHEHTYTHTSTHRLAFTHIHTRARARRYTDHVGGNEEMLDNLLVRKRLLNGWQLRTILENNATYVCAGHKHTYTHASTQRLAFTHTDTHRDTPTRHTHARTHTHTHARTHTHVTHFTRPRHTHHIHTPGRWAAQVRGCRGFAQVAAVHRH